MIVVDANVIVYAFTPCEMTARARAVIEGAGGVLVPRLWRQECANALVVIARKGLLSAKQAKQAFAEALSTFVIREREVDPQQALDGALSSGLSAYDSEYVTLARELRCRLVTNDMRVLKAVPDIALSLSAAVPQGDAHPMSPTG